ncbi:MAG: hypothetical protein IKL82_04200 [Clostridia bacterium]|nr:hypothetical protein [Clostridia bacterium]
MNVYEITIAPKNERADKIKMNIFAVLTAISVTGALICFNFAFMWENLMFIPTVLFVILIFVFLYGKHQYYNFYDLSFYDGEIKIVKVRNNNKRLLIARFNGKNITKIGLVSKTNVDFKEYKRLIATSKIESNSLLITFEDGESKLLVLPYEEGFLTALIRYYGVNKCEKGLIEYIKSK